MGMLAGSTVLLLTVIWGSCVIVGKCDLDDTKAIDLTNTKGYSLTGMFFRFSFSLLITYENQRAGSVTRDFYEYLNH
jgi:Ca2+/Na+ antiporter